MWCAGVLFVCADCVLIVCADCVLIRCQLEELTFKPVTNIARNKHVASKIGLARKDPAAYMLVSALCSV